MSTNLSIASATAGSPSSAKRVHPPHSSASAAPTVLLAGPWLQAEFAAVRAEIDSTHQWPIARSLTAAIEQLRLEAAPPDLILLAQPRPGVDNQEDVERLRRLAPLIRIIVVAGSWCEGELRTGQPLTGVVRLYWYEFPPWWRANCRAAAAQHSPSWSEPLTEIRSGQFIRFDAAIGTAAADRAGTIAVDSLDYSVFEALNGGLATYGWKCLWQPRHRPHLNRESPAPPTAALYDGAQLDPADLEALTELCTRMCAHHAPVIALVDFPRVEHIDMARKAGAAALLAKPCQLSLLADELARLVTPVERSRRDQSH
jgi:CheY-like chemotaxis protein